MSERRIFWTSAWLAIALVAVKAHYLNLVESVPGEGFEYVPSLAAISYGDVAFALAVWACARALTAWARNRASAAVAWIVAGLSALLLLYAAINVVLFKVFGGFLTASLLVLVRNIAFLSSAAGARLGPPVIAGLAALPILYLALVEVTLRVSKPMSAAWRYVLGATVVAAWLLYGHGAYAAPWAGRQDRRIAENAHWTLMTSCWRALTHGIVGMDREFPRDNLTDFDRPTQPARPTEPPASSRRSPNVVLIVLESVGARWTSLNSDLYDTTPNLRREGSRGVVFDAFYSHIGRSSNALAAMLMSTYPTLDFQDITDEHPRLPGTSLAEVFRAQGARTAFVTSSDLSWARWAEFLAGRGFDELRDYHQLSCSEPPSEWGVEDRCMVDGIIHFIGEHRDRPFFVMGWTTQTHYPYEPTPSVPFLDLVREPGPDQWELGRYLNALHETDRQMARVFTAIREAGLDDDTLTVTVGDHGQAFGYPHNSYAQGQTAYEEDVHVPLLIRFPRAYREGMRSPVLGGQIDLAPTITELAGLSAAADWQGRSLFAARRAPRVYFSVGEDRFILGVRENNWKYLYDLRQGAGELYDLDRDPNEQHNLASVESARSARLRQRLAAWMESNRRQYLQ